MPVATKDPRSPCPAAAAADTQGDISQARGQLGQLLFEFSQIELNRDLLDAIKRTESKTGALRCAALCCTVLVGRPAAIKAWQWAQRAAGAAPLAPTCSPGLTLAPSPPHLAGRSGGRPPAPGRLDRAAFELAVADAAELLQSQLR